MPAARRVLIPALIVLAVSAALAAGPRPLKILVLYDMEGVSEATTVKHTNFDTPEYRAARVSLIADVDREHRQGEVFRSAVEEQCVC